MSSFDSAEVPRGPGLLTAKLLDTESQKLPTWQSCEAKPVKHQQASLVHRNLRKTILALLCIETKKRRMEQTCHVSGQGVCDASRRSQASMASQRITCEHCSKTCTAGGSRSTITCHSGRPWYIRRVLQYVKLLKPTLQQQV